MAPNLYCLPMLLLIYDTIYFCEYIVDMYLQQYDIAYSDDDTNITIHAVIDKIVVGRISCRSISPLSGNFETH